MTRELAVPYVDGEVREDGGLLQLMKLRGKILTEHRILIHSEWGDDDVAHDGDRLQINIYILCM